MKDCIFCKLISGEYTAYVVYEDRDVFAFLDINPINVGHTLVIPKKHIEHFHEIDDKTYDKVMRTVKRLAKEIKGKLNPKRVGIMVMGWDVPHAHIHVVPIDDYHDITSKKLMENTLLKPTPEALKKTAKKIAITKTRK